MRKLIWIDTETTGLSATGNRIIEIAILYENLELHPDDLMSKDAFQAYIKYDKYPDNFSEIEKITGITKEFLAEKGEPEKYVYELLVNFLDKHIKKFDKQDKAILAGYNIKFDDGFLRELFKRYGDKYAYGCRFNSLAIDVRSTLATAISKGYVPQLENHKLEMVAKYFKLEMKAHKAMEDILATRKIQKKLEKLLKGNE